MKDLIKKILRESDLDWVDDLKNTLPSKIIFIFKPPISNVNEYRNILIKLEKTYPSLSWPNGKKPTDVKGTIRDYIMFKWYPIHQISVKNDTITVGDGTVISKEIEPNTNNIIMKTTFGDTIHIEPGDDEYENILDEMSYEQIDGRKYFEL